LPTNVGLTIVGALITGDSELITIDVAAESADCEGLLMPMPPQADPSEFSATQAGPATAQVGQSQEFGSDGVDATAVLGGSASEAGTGEFGSTQIDATAVLGGSASEAGTGEFGSTEIDATAVLGCSASEAGTVGFGSARFDRSASFSASAQFDLRNQFSMSSENEPSAQFSEIGIPPAGSRLIVASTVNGDAGSSGSISAGAICGIVIGAMILVIAIGLIIWFGLFRKAGSGAGESEDLEFDTEPASFNSQFLTEVAPDSVENEEIWSDNPDRE
jgi:hypothetical protein